jgi:hypothetical protein
LELVRQSVEQLRSIKLFLIPVRVAQAGPRKHISSVMISCLQTGFIGTKKITFLTILVKILLPTLHLVIAGINLTLLQRESMSTIQMLKLSC